MQTQGWSGWARYGVPGVVLGVALAVGFGGTRGPAVRAENIPAPDRTRGAAQPGGEASGTIAFTTNVNGLAQLLYLIDTRSRSFAVYRVEPTNPEGAVKLEAARQYQWDLKLTEYNNQKPEVVAVESMIKTLGRPAR